MKGVAPYYTTFGLPQQLADEVVYLRGVQLVRKNFEIKFSLKQEGTNPDSLTFETEMSYTLVNYSNDAQPFPFVPCYGRRTQSPTSTGRSKRVGPRAFAIRHDLHAVHAAIHSF